MFVHVVMIANPLILLHSNDGGMVGRILPHTIFDRMRLNRMRGVHGGLGGLYYGCITPNKYLIEILSIGKGVMSTNKFLHKIMRFGIFNIYFHFNITFCPFLEYI